MTNTPHVLQLRVVVEADDFDAAVAFYRDALGMPELMAFAESDTDDDDRVAILEAGRATLEIASPGHKRAIDAIEAGGRPSPRIRLAFEVTDASGTTRRLEGVGAQVVAEPVETPWRSRNARLEAPAGLQITVFEELADSHERAATAGFGTIDSRDQPPSPAAGTASM
jgi:predicted enzyme related to lactoylglutathione lyase